MSGRILSIGYGSRPFEVFADLLLDNNIQYLIDVRSKPYSRNPDYVRQRLNLLLKRNNIVYVFMGDMLGGRPSGDEQFDSDGRISYEMMSKTDHYIKGIARLRKAKDSNFKVILMCSEGKPEDCHRSKLIGETLRSISIEVQHIDEKGIVISQNDVISRIDPSLLQPSLFNRNTNSLTSRKVYADPNGVK